MKYFLPVVCSIMIFLVAATGNDAICANAAPQQKSATKARQRGKKTVPASNVKKSAPASTSRKPETSADVKKRQEATQKEIKLTEQQIKENERSVKAGLNELGKLESEISVSQKKIKESTRLISDLNGQISDLEEGILSNERELEKMRAQYLQAIKRMRATSRNRSALAFIFSSDSFNQAYRRMRYLKQFGAWRDRQSEMIAGKTEELQNRKEGLSQARKEHDKALKLQQGEESKLKERHERQNAVVADLKKNGQVLKKHLSKKQAEANELRGKIAELIAQEERKAAEERERKAAEERARKAEAEKAKKEAEEKARKAESEKRNKIADAEKSKKVAEKEKPVKSTEEKEKKVIAKSQEGEKKVVGNVSGGDFASMKGKLPRPASGEFRITSRFGRQSLPDLPDVVFDNPGIDAEVGAGSPAVAIFGGKVSGVYMLPGYHTVVIVNHGLYYTVYGNISTPAVKVGDEVRAGQSLGLLAPDEDDRSHSTIHFELWKGREKLNPQEWIR